MRFDLSLCPQEEEFIKKRDVKVLEGLKALLLERPISQDESVETSYSNEKFDSQESIKSPMTGSQSYDGLYERSSYEDMIQSSQMKKLPKLALVTSGGGFRAMIAYSGAYKVNKHKSWNNSMLLFFQALQEGGILDCIHYSAALSGSSWYLSTLYTHPKFPR